MCGLSMQRTRELLFKPLWKAQIPFVLLNTIKAITINIALAV